MAFYFQDHVIDSIPAPEVRDNIYPILEVKSPFTKKIFHYRLTPGEINHFTTIRGEQAQLLLCTEKYYLTLSCKG